MVFRLGDPEVVFKFRHPDEQTAAAVDVRPKIAGAYRIKFKAEVLPLKDEIGGFRVLYSHNCQFGASQMYDADKFSMGTLVKVFPALAKLEKAADEKLGLVNEGIVEEVLLPLGQLDFGKALVGKCDIGLWRTRGEHKSRSVSSPSRSSSPAKKTSRKSRRNWLGSSTLNCSGRCKTGWRWCDEDRHGLPPQGE